MPLNLWRASTLSGATSPDAIGNWRGSALAPGNRRGSAGAPWNRGGSARAPRNRELWCALVRAKSPVAIGCSKETDTNWGESLTLGTGSKRLRIKSMLRIRNVPKIDASHCQWGEK